LKQWDVPLKTPYSEDSSRAFSLEFAYDVDGILHVKATDIDSGAVILSDDVSYGVAGDKRQLKSMADRARESVQSGVLSKDASVKLDDPDSLRLIEQARVKVIPFLDESESKPVIDAVENLENADSSQVKVRREELKKLLMPYSYLF
jgi:hypothetical protein